MIYKGKGDLDQALIYLNKSLDIEINTFGDKNPALATTYNNIGIIYDSKGDLDQALIYYNKS